MPIKVPNDLPAVEKLQKENVFVMTDSRAMTQDIRPLEILILNLMPTKIDTETQLTRLLGNTPLQVELELLQTSTHKAKNVSEEHMLSFYKTFDQVKANYYDGMIITGAPVELMDFEEVEYWDELCEIMEWTKTHVHSTFHICWGAQAALYYHYGIQKHILPKKLSGVYEHRLDYSKGMLFRGFDDVFYVPHSRNTTVYREDIEKIPELKIIASSDKAGVFAVKSENDRQIFIMGHSEYDGDTLKKEYERDKKAGLDPDVPDNYFPDDDDTKPPIVRWRSCANLLYSNWLNYFVYQSTPYDIRRINEEDLAKPYVEKTDVNGVKVAKFGGTSLADADAFRRVADIIKSDKSRKYTVVSAPGYISEYDIKVTDYLVRAADAFEAGDRESSEKYIDKAGARFEAIADDLKSSIDETEQWDEFKRNFFSGAGREYLISRGEYSCAKLLAEFAGCDFVDAAEIIKFSTNGKFDVKSTKTAVEKVLGGKEHAVIPGFYGSDASGSVVTFPRGGSDITGAVIAADIDADMYENWTDVRGLLLADPKVIKSPLTVPVITYRELREMAVKGTEVVHEDAVIPVERVGIPMNIRCTAEPEHSGTLIVKNADYYESMLDISGISGKSDCAEITIEQEKLDEIPGFRKNLRNHLAERGIKVITELSGVDSINLVASRNEIGDAEELEADLKKATGAANVRIDTDMAVISVIGRKLDESPSISVRALEALAGNGIELKLIDEAAGRISMTIGVRKDSYVAGVKAIYEAFTRKGPED